MADSLFVPDGDHWLPTGLSRGPWSPDALHGGPVAALVCRAAEQAGGGFPGHIVRLTLELLRPVPLQPLDVRATVVRPGRKVRVVEVVLSAGNMDVAWARTVQIRTIDQGLVPDSPTGLARVDPDLFPEPEPLADPDTLENQAMGFGAGEAFHDGGAELRVARGKVQRLGPTAIWVRLLVPVVAGEEPSGAQRAAAASDFGNGVSSIVPFDRFSFINPDLTVYLERPPEGEWVGMDSSTRLGAPGVGLAQSALSDQHGPIGWSSQSLVVEPRE